MEGRKGELEEDGARKTHEDRTKVEERDREKGGGSVATGRRGIPSDFPRHFPASVAIGNFLGFAVIRRGGRISRPDANRCVRSNVRESQARTLSTGRSAHVTSSFSSIHPVARRTYYPLFFFLSSPSCSLCLSALPYLTSLFSSLPQFLTSGLRRHKRENQRARARAEREHYSSTISFSLSHSILPPLRLYFRLNNVPYEV